MAEFQEVIHNWQRMCKAVQDGNKYKIGTVWCINCPLHDNCWVDADFKDCGKTELNGIEETVQNWAKLNPEPVYPSWLEAMGWGELQWCDVKAILAKPMDSENAKKLGIEPKEVR